MSTSSSMACAEVLRKQGVVDRQRYLRRRLAQSSGTVSNVVPVNHPTPVMIEAPPSSADRRPQARDKRPCPRCQTRGDLGCKHFAPCGKDFA